MEQGQGMPEADCFDGFHLLFVQLVQIPVDTVDARFYLFIFKKIIGCQELTDRIDQTGDDQVPEAVVQFKRSVATDC